MDRKKIFKEIENGNFYLQDADEKLKADKEVVLALSDKFKKNKDVVLENLKY